MFWLIHVDLLNSKLISFTNRNRWRPSKGHLGTLKGHCWEEYLAPFFVFWVECKLKSSPEGCLILHQFTFKVRLSCLHFFRYSPQNKYFKITVVKYIG